MGRKINNLSIFLRKEAKSLSERNGNRSNEGAVQPRWNSFAAIYINPSPRWRCCNISSVKFCKHSSPRLKLDFQNFYFVILLVTAQLCNSCFDREQRIQKGCSIKLCTTTLRAQSSKSYNVFLISLEHCKLHLKIIFQLIIILLQYDYHHQHRHSPPYHEGHHHSPWVASEVKSQSSSVEGGHVEILHLGHFLKWTLCWDPGFTSYNFLLSKAWLHVQKQNNSTFWLSAKVQMCKSLTTFWLSARIFSSLQSGTSG